MYEVWKWSPSPRGGGGRVLGDLLTLLVSWVTQAIHGYMQHTHLNVHCALIQLTVAVPPMLVYLRLEWDQNQDQRGTGHEPPHGTCTA